MSRVGIKPIIVPASVTITLEPTTLKAVGPKGELNVEIPHGVKIALADGKLTVSRVSDVKLYKSLHGTVRALAQNAVTGAEQGFEKKLELIGIGYRAAIEGDDLVLQVGFTHPVRVKILDGLEVKIEKNVITVAGRDKHQIGQFAADLRAIRKPDPYKGKGIRYQGEIVRMKQGKAVKDGA